jgi:hypothetical protein
MKCKHEKSIDWYIPINLAKPGCLILMGSHKILNFSFRFSGCSETPLHIEWFCLQWLKRI